MPADPQFDYWTREIELRDQQKFVATIDVPFIQSRETTAEISGYWRVMAARTKTNWPLLIWRDADAGQSQHLVQWGGGRPKVLKDAEYDDLRTFTLPHLAAIREVEFEQAVRSKAWPDGLIAIPSDPNERFDIIPDTPASEGGNMATGEDGEPVDAYHEQIVTKLAALMEKGKAIKVTDAGTAQKAAAIRDDILALGKMGEARRKEEAKPFDDGKAKVQNKWVPSLQPASALAIALLNAIEDWKRAERRRLEAEERKRIAEETAKRIADEAEARKQAAEAAGQVAADIPTAEEIEAQATAEAAAAPVQVEAPRVQGSATARAASKAKTVKAKIVDAGLLATHLIDSNDADMIAYLQKRADAALRAKITLPGTEADND